MTFPYKLIDLTHTLSSDVPTWDGSCGFKHHLHFDYNPKSDYSFRTHTIHMNEGIGTHMDAPAHCIPGGLTIDQLPLENFIAPCVVIDISNQAHERYSLSVQDIEAFEEEHGLIQPGSFVIIRTGWDQFWTQPERYQNNHVFPSISKVAAALLLTRKIVGIGIDTLSLDRPEDGFPVHKLLLEAGKYIVENVANSAALPPIGSYTLALPIKQRAERRPPYD